MGAGAKNHFHALDEIGIAVVVGAEGGTRLFGVNEAHGNARGDEL